jgi:hypothetical protein
MQHSTQYYMYHNTIQYRTVQCSSHADVGYAQDSKICERLDLGCANVG